MALGYIVPVIIETQVQLPSDQVKLNSEEGGATLNVAAERIVRGMTAKQIMSRATHASAVVAPGSARAYSRSAS